MLLGVNLTLRMGPTTPIPVTPEIAEAVHSISVNHNDEGQSGFQIMLQVGRAGPADLPDYKLLLSPLLQPFSRVILIVLFDAQPTVLMDGIVTNQQMSPGSQPGTATLTLTGEDISVMMDLEQKRVEHPALSEDRVAEKIIAQYKRFGIVGDVVAPKQREEPAPTERTPVQQGTDLEHLRTIARYFGHVFYIEQGAVPGRNVGYWGPPKRDGSAQPALSVNVGPGTNVESIGFTYNARAPTIVKDTIQASDTNDVVTVSATAGTRTPLSARPAPLDPPKVRTSLLQSGAAGLTGSQANAQAQSIVDRALEDVVTAQGELDALQYGRVLKPRTLVGVRGAGGTYDGMYYVKSVSHAISKGQYKQRFTLTREGVGALSPRVTT